MIEPLTETPRYVDGPDIKNDPLNLKVTPDEGLSVRVQAGSFFSNGEGFYLTEGEVIPLPQATNVAGESHRVAVFGDNVDGFRVEVYTSGTFPDGDIVCDLAEVKVRYGATNIADEEVRDLRFFTDDDRAYWVSEAARPFAAMFLPGTIGIEIIGGKMFVCDGGNWHEVATGDTSSSHTHAGTSITSAVTNARFAEGTMMAHERSASGPGPWYQVWADADGRFMRNTSSIRYKKDVELWNGPGLDTILAIAPVTYLRIDGHNKRELGLIAEAVEEWLPELVEYDKKGRPDGVRYDLLALPLLQAVRELSGKVQSLQAQIDKMKEDA